jgi:hypothetical protein
MGPACAIDGKIGRSVKRMSLAFTGMRHGVSLRPGIIGRPDTFSFERDAQTVRLRCQLQIQLTTRRLQRLCLQPISLRQKGMG